LEASKARIDGGRLWKKTRVNERVGVIRHGSNHQRQRRLDRQESSVAIRFLCNRGAFSALSHGSLPSDMHGIWNLYICSDVDMLMFQTPVLESYGSMRRVHRLVRGSQYHRCRRDPIEAPRADRPKVEEVPRPASGRAEPAVRLLYRTRVVQDGPGFHRRVRQVSWTCRHE
jgi:hypothetical protein